LITSIILQRETAGTFEFRNSGLGETGDDLDDAKMHINVGIIFLIGFEIERKVYL